ncbi:hypothetical protein T552_00526 [Pneumocystis carinii B80]|uniref:GRIP domain-containing protein n=1 Tax=Pneumocystis carinii (strain B80) TaxID=1408658 RepID=A0A0W4ZR27_PNEC8|nr:hypothetical protein T552_00526 [Pneumocystis carinii B80]KTW30814.1 hypothetical protein T552_00526 [Pneumocystis carinii B80]
MSKSYQKNYSYGQKMKFKTKNPNAKKKHNNNQSFEDNRENLIEGFALDKSLKNNQTFAQEISLNKLSTLQRFIVEPSNIPERNEYCDRKELLDSHIDNNMEQIINKTKTCNISNKMNEMKEDYDRENENEVSVDLKKTWLQEREFFLLEISKLQDSLKAQESRFYSVIEENEKKLETVLDEKQQLELQYRGLLGKLSSIKQGLEEKLKADSEDLASTKKTIEELKKKNSALLEEISCLKKELIDTNNDCYKKSKEIVELHDKIDRSEKNWINEKDILYKQQSNYIENLEKYKKISKDWKEIALEERSHKDDFKKKVDDFEERIKEYENSLKQSQSLNNNLKKENEKNNQVIDEYKMKIDKISEDYKSDLNEATNELQAKIDTLNDKNSQLEAQINSLVLEDEKDKKEIERLKVFEKEIKEKNLLIGKLRHEAVILNEHLVKTLNLLRRNNSEDNIDKKLVTNLILSFITLPRDDAKRYEILQLMSAFLQWTDEQKELSGLIRSRKSSFKDVLFGSNVSSEPLSYNSSNFDYKFHINQALSDNKSMSDLWINFLQNEISTKDPNLNK